MTEPRPARLLIVDDERANIQILHAALAGLGVVQFATSGEQALKLARDTPPDVVLLDIVMAGMDGFAVCAALAGDPATRDALVVLVSGTGDDADVGRGLDAGAIDFIVKPAVPALVRRRVETLLELKRLREAAAR